MAHADDVDPISVLVTNIQRGDQAALRRLYSVASPKLFAIALRIVKRRSLAEDVIQDVFVRIWQHCHDYTPDKGSVWAWMTTIVRNRAIDCIRQDREILMDPEDAMWEQTDPGDGPMQTFLRHESAGAIRRCLEKLPKEQRQVILVAYYEGRTHDAIAHLIDVPLGTVKTWIRRGLMRIKECLQA